MGIPDELPADGHEWRRFRALHSAMMLQQLFQPIRIRNSFCEAAVTLLESHRFTEWSQTFRYLDKDVGHALGGQALEELIGATNDAGPNREHLVVLGERGARASGR